MATTTAMCNSFKQQLLQGKHSFESAGGHTFNIALIKSSPAGTYGASTTNYSDVTGNSDEATGTGYSAGGNALTNNGVSLTTGVAYVDFADSTWSSATITASAAIIYNTTTDGGSSTDDAVATLDFGGDKTSTNGDFVVQFPTADSSTAVIRIS